MNDANLPTDIPAGLYDDIEHSILCDWLGLERPPALADIDIDASTLNNPGPDGTSPVRLPAGAGGYEGTRETQLANAVARIALNAIAARLPQWRSRSASGDWTVGREGQPRRTTTIDPLPRHLLTINWADSGPGFSWPEAYHATWLPGFDRFVVTLSDDSPDVHGYTDLAIGHFAGDADFDREIERIVCGFWSSHTDADTDQAWQDLWDAGHVGWDTAYAWRETVWGIGEDDEPVDENDWEDVDADEA